MGPDWWKDNQDDIQDMFTYIFERRLKKESSKEDEGGAWFN
jgi:hypothetical protein